MAHDDELARDRRWWTVDEDEDLHGAVLAAVAVIKQESGEARAKRNLNYIALYENRDLSQLTYGESGDLTLNIASSCVDVLGSKIAPNRPKPQYLTVDGDFSAQMKAKNRQRFVMGNFMEGQVYKKSVDVFLDAGICDIGAMKVTGSGDRVEYERVFPNEILVDERAALAGDPRELFQEKLVATDVLCAQFPEHAEEIRRSSKTEASDIEMSRGIVDDMVQVVEAWRLPSSMGGTDGRHTIAVSQATLFDEKWKDDSFPFAFLRWTKLRRGFYGQGLVEQLHGIQEEITELVLRIQRAHRILGVPWVLKPRGCNVKNGSWTNQVGEIMEYDGPPPEVDVHAVMAPEVYAHLDYLFTKAFEVSGISQLSATAKKPAGIESGVALRTLLDTETQRFALLVDAWQEFFLELARQTVNQAQRMGKATTTWRMREWGRKIDWVDVAGDDDDRYVLQLWPVNLLPDTPAGKLAYIEQMITIGVIDPDAAQSLLDFPDIEAHQRHSAAARDLIEQIVEVMLTEGRYIAPSKFMPLMNPDGSPGMAIQIVQGSLLRGQVNRWPEDKLALLVDWLDEAVLIGQPPLPPEAMPPGQPPGPMPEMPIEQPPGPMPV